MYTVCPKCALPLAVTAADLRAGQGYVRCGRCANVFNALLRLSDESASGEGGDPVSSSYTYIEMEKASATLSRPTLPEHEDEAPIGAVIPEPEPLFASELPDVPIQHAGSVEEQEEQDPDSTNPKIGKAPLDLVPPQPNLRSPGLRLVDTPPRAPQPDLDIEELAEEQAVEPAADADAERDEDFADDEFGKYQGTGTFETIVLEGDTFLQTEETIPEEVLASEIANVSRRIAEAHHTAEFAALMEGHFEDDVESPPGQTETEADPAPELAALREATGEFQQRAQEKWKDEDPGHWFRSIRSKGDWRLITGAVVLALIFIVQALNHWRDDLATHAGWFGPMSALASTLGEPLHPSWDLGAYDLRQLGAAADSPDNQTLKVRLSLTNVGAHAQALPLIRLTLRDRYGKAVSRGELSPAQYLPKDAHGQQMIRRDQRIDTELRILDPTRQASSFELDVCVSAAGGALRCAGDSPTLSARQS